MRVPCTASADSEVGRSYERSGEHFLVVVVVVVVVVAAGILGTETEHIHVPCCLEHTSRNDCNSRLLTGVYQK